MRHIAEPSISFPILLLFLILALPYPVMAAGEGNDSSPGISVGGMYFSDGDWKNRSHRHHSPDDTSLGIPTPGTWPTGLDKADTTTFWHCDIDMGMVYQLGLNPGDTAFTIISSFQSPSENPALRSPGGILWLDSRVWMVNEQEGKLYQYNPDQPDTVVYRSLPDSAAIDPNSFGLAWDGQYLWHSQYGAQARIFKLDTTDCQMVFSFFPPTDYILGITYKDGYLYGVDKNERRLYKINPVGGFVVEVFDWDVPYPLGLDWDGEYWWNVSSRVDSGGRAAVFRASVGTSVETPETRITPGGFAVIEAYPNPFNQRSLVSFFIERPGNARLAVYDIAGREVAVIAEGFYPAGTHRALWEGTAAGSGVFIVRLQGDGFEAARRVVLVK